MESTTGLTKDAGWQLGLRVTPAATGATIGFHQDHLASAADRARLLEHWASVADRLRATLEK